MFKNKFYSVRIGNKAILSIMLRGHGTNSVHLPRNKSSWLHHYPPYLNPTSSHKEDNGTSLKGSLKALFGYPIKEDTKGPLDISPNSIMTIPIPSIQLNLTLISSRG